MAPQVPDDAVFTVPYSYTPPGESATTGTLDLTKNGDPQGINNLPAGTVVTLNETTPPAVLGVNWDTALFSVNGLSFASAPAQFTIGSGATIQIVLTNNAAQIRGSVQIEKAIAGPTASLVPQDTVFPVNYAYTAEGKTHTGTLSLKPSDRPHVFSDLPLNTKVIFNEVSPPNIPGVVWGEPSFRIGSENLRTTATITVRDTSSITIILTNTAEEPALIEDVPANVPISPINLPNTGLDIFAWIVAVIAIVALGIGLAVYGIRRRRQGK